MNQKGFTLLEIMVVMAVGGMVMAAALFSIYQVIWDSTRSNDQVKALTDVNYAARWIKRDIQMSRYTGLIDGDPVPQSSVWLSWIDNTGFASENESMHYSSYTLSGTELRREYDNRETIIGRHITSIGFILNDDIIACNITATGTGATERSETLKFSVRKRAEEAQ